MTVARNLSWNLPSFCSRKQSEAGASGTDALPNFLYYLLNFITMRNKLPHHITLYFVNIYFVLYKEKPR
jgi:hypothetical protein